VQLCIENYAWRCWLKILMIIQAGYIWMQTIGKGKWMVGSPTEKKIRSANFKLINIIVHYSGFSTIHLYPITLNFQSFTSVPKIPPPTIILLPG
jgi:hypothetical protein